MVDYPEWVQKYKTKGVYLKKGKSGYFLYKGHSERVPEKKYPVFKCDEYLGMVTEKDGFIPSSPSVKPDVVVLRYGFFQIADGCCHKPRYSPLMQQMNIDTIYTHALLSVEGEDSITAYRGSWLSHVFPNVDMEAELDNQQINMIERLKKQIKSKLQQKYGKDLQSVLSEARNVYAVYVNGKWVTSLIPEFLEKYEIDFSIKEK